MARRILYFFVIQYALRGICRHFLACGWQCDVNGSGADGKAKEQPVGCRCSFACAGAGRHMALATWMATGCIFQYVFFKCGGFEPRCYAGAQGLFCIMFL